MINRVLLSFVGFLMAIYSVSAFSLADPFIQAFGEKGLFGILQNAFVVMSLIYVSMLMGFHSILRVLLKPLFGSNMKETNVIAFMISFIGTTGIFFIYRASPEVMVSTIGGTVGLFLLILLMVAGLKGLDHLLVEVFSYERVGTKYLSWMSIALFFILTALLGFINQIIASTSGTSLFTVLKDSIKSIQGIILMFVLGILVYLLFNVRKLGKEEEKEVEKEVDNDPVAKDILETTKRINTRLSKIQNLLQTINQLLKSK